MFLLLLNNKLTEINLQQILDQLTALEEKYNIPNS